MANTLWCGNTNDKLFLTSGEHTTTVKDSEPIGSIDTLPQGISWDGVNTVWSGEGAYKHYLQSGLFTSTLKTSQLISVYSLSPPVTAPSGVCADGANTMFNAYSPDKLWLGSGQFTSTLKTSISVGGVDTLPMGLSWDGVNTPWNGRQEQKLYLQSGKYTSTLKTSQDVTVWDGSSQGVGWNGTDTPFCGSGSNGLYLVSGQFSSTLKNSVSIGSLDTNVFGMSSDDFDVRVGVVNVTILVATISLSMAQEDIVLPGLEVTVVIGAELSLISAVPAPSLSGTANVPVATLPLGMTQEGVTFIAGVDVFVSLLPIALTAEIAGAVVVSGDVSLLMPDTSMILIAIGLSIHAPTVNIENDVRTLVTNTRNFAISEYSNFGFNSMCKFNGKYLYARSDGIYEDGGDDDNGTQIDASYKTGSIDIYATEIQRLRDAFLTIRSNGTIQLFSVGDEVNTRTYPIILSTPALHERRVKFERGIRDRHFNFGVSNVNGSTLEVDSIKILSEPIRKRR
jgi:hypothetical protein